MTTYTVVVDESGEAGISKVRTGSSGGASPYLTLGACIYRTETEDELISDLDRVKVLLKKADLHCSSLGHFHKVRYAREISNNKFMAFGVISDKSTLGGYKSKILENSKMYYNKCSQYLLEQIGRFIKEYGLDPNEVSIIFEEGNFDYQSLRNLIEKCQKTPIHENAKFLRYVRAERIVARPKKDMLTLCLADLVAHALYKCVDKSDRDFQIPESRYLKELSSKFYADKKNKSILGYGIKCIHNVDKLDLDDDIVEVLKNLKAKAF
ncbi:DUF3800 domain-containing protein [Rhizobium sp. BE258]|uniref:DUF3800 domain-containing protein n=1 Tax=Rhizobium sp. BE258 TaxID=2817722 RepID=UPI00285B6085|nr:DUF3800 domain-containing protein [Rhizobium sp. BE258]MDR7147188.1 hypothetical protein [Rhizobium sp. BE258]